MIRVLLKRWRQTGPDCIGEIVGKTIDIEAPELEEALGKWDLVSVEIRKDENKKGE